MSPKLSLLLDVSTGSCLLWYCFDIADGGSSWEGFTDGTGGCVDSVFSLGSRALREDLTAPRFLKEKDREGKRRIRRGRRREKVVSD